MLYTEFRNPFCITSVKFICPDIPKKKSNQIYCMLVFLNVQWEYFVTEPLENILWRMLITCNYIDFFTIWKRNLFY